MVIAADAIDDDDAFHADAACAMSRAAAVEAMIAMI